MLLGRSRHVRRKNCCNVVCLKVKYTTRVRGVITCKSVNVERVRLELYSCYRGYLDRMKQSLGAIALLRIYGMRDRRCCAPCWLLRDNCTISGMYLLFNRIHGSVYLIRKRSRRWRPVYTLNLLVLSAFFHPRYGIA